MTQRSVRADRKISSIEGFLKERFVRYNRNVKDYFRFKDTLLTINVADDGAYQK